VVLVLVILIAIHHDEIVTVCNIRKEREEREMNANGSGKQKLRPVSEKIRDLPGGFIIPVIILIAISFPPLFGHEIVALLCGVVWGLWIGYASFLFHATVDTNEPG